MDAIMFTKCLIGNFGGKNVSLYINIVKNLCTHKMLYLRQFESMSTHLQGGINTVQCTYLIHSKQYINLLAKAFVRKKIDETLKNPYRFMKLIRKMIKITNLLIKL